MITVTLQQIKDSGCSNLALRVGAISKTDMSTHLSLISILDSNGLYCALEVIANVRELSKYSDTWRSFACWCALQNVGKITNRIEKESCSLIVNWLNTKNSEIQNNVWLTAWSSAWVNAEPLISYSDELAVDYAIEAVAWSASIYAGVAALNASLSSVSSAKNSGEATCSVERLQESKLRELLVEQSSSELEC